MQTTAQRIKQALEIRKMKQADLVEKTGISKSSISTYLSGKYEPKQTNTYLIAKALDVDPTWLMGLDVPMENKKNFLSDYEIASMMNKIRHDEDVQQLVKMYYELSEENKKRVIDIMKGLSGN